MSMRQPSETTRSPGPTTDLFLLEDLEDDARTRRLTEADVDGLRAVAGWITTFVASPHPELGRGGPVCPFVPRALENRTLWLAAQHTANRSVREIISAVREYEGAFLDRRSVDGDVDHQALVIVFTDLAPERAPAFFDEVLQSLQVPAYTHDGVVLGTFYDTNPGTAIYNADFRPFTSPVPFLLVRYAVVSDWKFFLGDDQALRRWAHRFGETATEALGDELRRLPWRDTVDR